MIQLLAILLDILSPSYQLCAVLTSCAVLTNTIQYTTLATDVQFNKQPSFKSQLTCTVSRRCASSRAPAAPTFVSASCRSSCTWTVGEDFRKFFGLEGSSWKKWGTSINLNRKTVRNNQPWDPRAFAGAPEGRPCWSTASRSVCIGTSADAIQVLVRNFYCFVRTGALLLLLIV